MQLIVVLAEIFITDLLKQKEKFAQWASSFINGHCFIVDTHHRKTKQ